MEHAGHSGLSNNFNRSLVVGVPTHIEPVGGGVGFETSVSPSKNTGGGGVGRKETPQEDQIRRCVS